MNQVRTWAVGLIAIPLCASAASGELIAGWNFNSYDGNAHSISAEWGSGLLTIDAGWRSADLGTDAGTTLNTSFEDPAGAAIDLYDKRSTGRGIELAVSTVGLEDIALSFASMRDAGGGFEINQVLYSTDGGSNFAAFGSPFDPGTSFTLMQFDLSSISDLNDNAAAVFRIEFDGGYNGSGKGILVDNFRITGTLIPGPGTLALLGVAGTLLARRRRR
jgi:hypothetical protein